MAEETWHRARLIPTSGINGAGEQERRATSALLAVMNSVREFGRTLTQPLGAPAGPVETYIEVPFLLGERTYIPDGLIRVSRGKKQWTALVEVKTQANELTSDQVEAYLDVARQEGYDAVITISNQVPASAGQHPTKVDKRKLTRVSLFHYSWSEVLFAAVMQKEFRGVADPDQAWILGELIRYMEHDRSGVLEFQDMGESWVPVRNSIANGTLRSTDQGVAEVAGRLDALIRHVGLVLGRRLGTEVFPLLSRAEMNDPARRSLRVVTDLVTSGTFTASIQIPDTVGALVLTADLRSNQITCHVDIDAPRTGRATTRVNWLVRQLANSPENLRVESFAHYARGAGAAELLRTVRDNPNTLVPDATKELRSFRLALSKPLGSKRSGVRGSFITSVLDAVDAFYGDVLQNIRAWTAAPPRMRDLHEEPAVQPAALSSTALSSQDGVEGIELSRSGSNVSSVSTTNHVQAHGTSDEPARHIDLPAEAARPTIPES